MIYGNKFELSYLITDRSRYHFLLYNSQTYHSFYKRYLYSQDIGEDWVLMRKPDVEHDLIMGIFAKRKEGLVL